MGLFCKIAFGFWRLAGELGLFCEIGSWGVGVLEIGFVFSMHFVHRTRRTSVRGLNNKGSLLAMVYKWIL